MIDLPLSFIKPVFSFIAEYGPTALIVMLLFSGTVFIHELGHFLTAKWFGLRIDAFSIGMGPAIWQKEVNGVMYKISWLPIGGYVALPQLDITGSAFENQDAKAGRLEPVAPWKRIIIALAGPAMNIVAAFGLAVIIWYAGKPADPGIQPPVVGYVDEESPAYEKGLREGDRIVMANQDKMVFWSDLEMSAALNRDLDLKIVRNGQIEYLYDVSTTPNRYGYRVMRGVRPEMPEMKGVDVIGLQEDSPARKAGLNPGDAILEINGKKVDSYEMFTEAVRLSEGEPIRLTVRPEGENDLKTVVVSAEWNEKAERWLIGIMMGVHYADVHPAPLRQIRYFTGVITRTFKAFARKKERMEAASQVGGAVMILGSMGMTVKNSIIEGLWITALVNVNLAIINLLPLIILDGGHIMVALYEMVSGRKPHRGLITGMANVMVVVLLSLMVLLTFKDIRFFIDIFSEEEPAIEATAEPENQTGPEPGASSPADAGTP